MGLCPPAEAKVALAPELEYQVLVDAAFAQGGWIALPRLGEALPRALGWTFAPATTPTAALDVAAHWLQARQGPAVVLSRTVTPGQASLQRSLTPIGARFEALRTAQNDLLALGLAAACLERAGWGDVQVWVAGVPVYPWADESALAGLAQAGATGKGLITWTERPQGCGLAELVAPPTQRPARLV